MWVEILLWKKRMRKLNKFEKKIKTIKLQKKNNCEKVAQKLNNLKWSKAEKAKHKSTTGPEIKTTFRTVTEYFGIITLTENHKRQSKRRKKKKNGFHVLQFVHNQLKTETWAWQQCMMMMMMSFSMRLQKRHCDEML